MYSTWSMLTLVTTATSAVDHVGGVPGAPEAHLDHRHVDRDVAEPPQRGGGEDLEVARRVGQQVLDRGDRDEELVERRRRGSARRSRPCAR